MMSRRLGAKVDLSMRTVIFSRQAPPPDAPPGVEFVSRTIASTCSDRGGAPESHAALGLGNDSGRYLTNDLQ
jgi:hypothetical protein